MEMMKGKITRTIERTQFDEIFCDLNKYELWIKPYAILEKEEKEEVHLSIRYGYLSETLEQLAIDESALDLKHKIDVTKNERKYKTNEFENKTQYNSNININKNNKK